jgi:hypothetical protein
MLLTEEEARKQQCCREVQNPCAASKCQGWRWGESPYEEMQGVNYLTKDRHGYCGLAGEVKFP